MIDTNDMKTTNIMNLHLVIIIADSIIYIDIHSWYHLSMMLLLLVIALIGSKYVNVFVVSVRG